MLKTMQETYNDACRAALGDDPEEALAAIKPDVATRDILASVRYAVENYSGDKLRSKLQVIGAVQGLNTDVLSEDCS